ncbi:hypothetical protein V5O48_017029 [Marasmius crinis-equi]|uniref:Glycoside hydrolase family 76 protein n=1 Tax=Marasmius crinis-equi TaxID=585013 RepID=A0ABR3EQ39_9AGAR
MLTKFSDRSKQQRDNLKLYGRVSSVRTSAPYLAKINSSQSSSSLSASLAAVTSNQTYNDYARKTAEFLQRGLLYQNNGTFWNWLDPRSCTPKMNAPTFPVDTGSIIHALSIFAGLNQNTSTLAFLHDVVPGATTFNNWHDGSGILSLPDNSEGLSQLIRGFAELYKANNTPTDLKSYLKSYLSNQARFNAVTQLSTAAGSNIYGGIWDGLPASQFNNQFQAAAISALLGGSILSQDDEDSGPALPPKSSPDPAASVPTKAIIGGVVGGVVGGAIVTLAIWLFRRRKNQIKESKEEPSDPEFTISPFDLSASPVNPKSRRPGNLEQTHERDTDVDWSCSIGNDSESVGDAATTTTQAFEALVEDLRWALNQQVQTERMHNERGWETDENPPQYQESEQGRGV